MVFQEDIKGDAVALYVHLYNFAEYTELAKLCLHLLTLRQPWLWNVRRPYQTWTQWRSRYRTCLTQVCAPTSWFETGTRQTASSDFPRKTLLKFAENKWTDPWLVIQHLDLTSALWEWRTVVWGTHRSLTSDGTINCFLFQCVMVNILSLTLKSVLTSYQISVVQHYD